MGIIKKSLLIIASFVGVLFTVLAIWIGYSVYQCDGFLLGVSNFDLVSIDGISVLKTTGKPYTGKAYGSVCGGECGMCGELHWRGEYKEGKWHGKFDIPVSGLGDAHSFGLGDETQTYFYENGKRTQ